MKSLRATAPGKLVLCGEYAVLDGAPAISAAVDRRARVTLHEAEGEVVVRTVGFRDGEYRFRMEASGLEPVRKQDELPLVQAAIGNAGLAVGAGLDVELDTSSFFAGDTKLGLGSSAALTAALVPALAEWQGQDSHKSRLRTQAVHSHLQGGHGSGVDIRTSIEGGLIRFRREVERDDGRTATITHSFRTVAWPGGLEAAVLFSGIAASTPQKLARLDAQSRDPVSDELVDAARSAADAWQGGDVQAVLAATAGFTRTLKRFSDTYALDVFGGGHASLTELAESQGLVYKPCGAGGGDVGIVLGDNTEGIAQFVERATASGFTELDVRLGGKTEVEGLSVEWTHD